MHILLHVNITVTELQCSERCLGPTTSVQKRSVACQHVNASLYTDCALSDRYKQTHNTDNIDSVYQIYLVNLSRTKIKTKVSQIESISKLVLN